MKNKVRYLRANHRGSNWKSGGKKQERKKELDSTDRIEETIREKFLSNFEFLEEEVENSPLSGDKKVKMLSKF